MPGSRRHVVIGDEFDFIGDRCRVAAIHDDPVFGTMVELVDITPGRAPAPPVVIPLSLLLDVVEAHEEVEAMYLTGGPSIDRAA
ncbi:hypothetical protein [Sphingomonas parapaucimobilis]|uniref:hypothetical protein n=1 Tax=Sphingomonas parapaucimobilis TaxID=28213 RepID=UPI00321B8C7B